MSDLRINIGERAIEATLNAFETGRGEQLLGAVLSLFETLAPAVQTSVLRQIKKVGLRKRTGLLAQSILTKATLVVEKRNAPGISTGVFQGPALAYAATQEFGTKGIEPDSPIDTIEPVRSKYLWMPAGSDTVFPSGASRFKSVRDYPGELVIIPIKNRKRLAGVAFDADRYEQGIENDLTIREIEAAYLLLREVDIKPKHFMYDGFLEVIPLIEKRLEARILELFNAK